MVMEAPAAAAPQPPQPPGARQQLQAQPQQPLAMSLDEVAVRFLTPPPAAGTGPGSAPGRQRRGSSSSTTAADPPPLWAPAKVMAALIRQPHYSLSPPGHCWTSLLGQALPADAVRAVDLNSIRTCQPHNFATLLHVCVEQLVLFVTYTAMVLETYAPDVRQIRGVLRAARRHHTTVYSALQLLEGIMSVMFHPHPTIDFADALLMKNKTLEDRDTTKAFTQLAGSRLEKTMGYVVTDTLLRLMHCPDFTVDPPTVEGLAKYLGQGCFKCVGTGLSSVAERELLWGTFADRQGHTRFRTARRNVLRGALATLVPQGAAMQAPYTRPLFYRLWTEPAVPLVHRGTLFASLLNIVCGWDPEGGDVGRWLPYYATATRDKSQEELVEYALHLLLAVLQHSRFYSISDEEDARPLAPGQAVGMRRRSGSGHIRGIEEVLDTDHFQLLLTRLGSSGSKDMYFVARGILGKLRLSLGVRDALWGAGAGAYAATPFLPELLLLLSHFVEVSHEFRQHLCSEAELFPTVELLLFHLAAAIHDGVRKEAPVAASCCVNILLHLSTEPGVSESIQRLWANPASLKHVLANTTEASAGGAAAAHKAADPSHPYSTIEVVYLVMTDVLLSDLPWVREQTVCYDMAANVLLNFAPYLARPSLVVCDRLACLMEVFSHPPYLHDERSTNFYFVCILLEVYFYSLCFNWKANGALVRSLLRRKPAFEALNNAIGAEQGSWPPVNGAAEAGYNAPSRSPVPTARHYTRENWTSRAFLKPLLVFLRAVDSAYHDRFRNAVELTDSDVLTWLRAYLAAPKGAVDLFTLAKGAHFNPTITATPLQYSLQDRFAWMQLAAPKHYKPLCNPADVVMLKVGMKPAHP